MTAKNKGQVHSSIKQRAELEHTLEHTNTFKQKALYKNTNTDYKMHQVINWIRSKKYRNAPEKYQNIR